MPPSSNVEPHHITRLENWLDCGGPGNAIPWPETQEPSPLTLSSTVLAQVTVTLHDPELLDVSRVLDQDHSLLLIERWLIDGEDLWLVERERRDAIGDLIFLDQWSPPLGVLRAGKPAGPTTTWRLHTEDGVSTEEEEQWHSESADMALFDPQRDLDEDAEAVLLTSDTGVVIGLLLGPSGATQHWYEEVGLDPLGDLLSFRWATSDRGAELADQMLTPNQVWVEHIFGMELQ